MDATHIIIRRYITYTIHALATIVCNTNCIQLHKWLPAKYRWPITIVHMHTHTKTKLWTIFSSSSLFILCCCESVVWSFLWRQFVRDFLHSLHTRSPRIYRVNQDLFPPKLGLIHITNGILMTTHKLHFLIVMVLCVCVCLTGFWECVNLYSAHVSPMVIIAWKKWKTFG